MNTPSRLTALPTAAILGALLLSSCGMATLTTTYDKSEEHSVTTAQAGKASGLLAPWVPDEATDLRLMVRTTGNERLLRATYDGALPPSCQTIEAHGAPNPEELTRAYASEKHTEGFDVEDFTTAPLLEAAWWPEEQEKYTTALCGRWWVSQSDSEIFAFAPELNLVADNVVRERAATQD